jgi:hypothetical protein
LCVGRERGGKEGEKERKVDFFHLSRARASAGIDRAIASTIDVWDSIHSLTSIDAAMAACSIASSSINASSSSGSADPPPAGFGGGNMAL